MQLTKSYKFKLLPTASQRLFLYDYFSRFQKAVNFAAKKIPKVEEDQKRIYEFVKEGIRGKCSYCGESYKQCKEHKPQGKSPRDRNKICKACNQKSLVNRKKKKGKELVCQKCWNREFSIRKILYATRGRKRGSYGDIKDAARLPGTEYNLAFKRAADTLKSYKRQLNRIKGQIAYKERRLKEWEEVLKDEKIRLKELEERYKNNESLKETLESLRTRFKKKKTISARFVLPRQPGQKVDRYKHIIYKDNLSKGKTESQIKQAIKALTKTVEKLNKRLRETRINFNGTIVDLQNTAVKDISEACVELSIDGRKEKFTIAAKSVRTSKGKEWLLKIIKRIKRSKSRYPLLLKKGTDFYLSYPIRQDLREPKIDGKTKVMGIDRGVNQIAVTVVIAKPDSKPAHIKFYSGKGLMKDKVKYQLIRKKFTGTKSVNRRRAKFGKKVSRISDYLLHNISKQIVKQARGLKPVVISMENLKITQGEKRIKRGSARGEKRISFMLSNFVYGKLQKLIEYKALEAGIPVRYIKPEYTSQQCSVCYRVGKRVKGYFECMNSECGHKMNADLNAAMNIANSLYKEVRQ